MSALANLKQLEDDLWEAADELLEDLMKIFNRQSIRGASGDVFGRIYEYFLRQFAMKKAHDDGEFFTPPSLVQMIVNVIEPGLAPPFNVDKIDAAKVKHDHRRLPFGLPGVNKQGRVSNGNYVWIAYLTDS